MVRIDTPVIEHQQRALLIQAAPVNGTWYTAMDTKKLVRIYIITLKVATTGETIALRITIDGEVYTATIAGVADTTYYCYLGVGNWINYATAHINACGYSNLEGRSIKVEFRKSTANGAGSITCVVEHGLFKP